MFTPVLVFHLNSAAILEMETALGKFYKKIDATHQVMELNSTFFERGGANSFSAAKELENI